MYPAEKKIGVQPDTKVAHYYAREWQKMGHEVRVVFLSMNPVKKLGQEGYAILPTKEIEYEYEGVPVCLIKMQLLVPHTNRPLKIQARCVEHNLRRYFRKRVPDYMPDQIFVHFPLSFYGIHLSKMFVTRISAVFHNCDIDQLMSLSDPCAKKYVDSFSSVGSRNKKIRESLFQKTGKESYVLYSGIPESVIEDPQSCIFCKGEKRHELNILFAGNLIPLKNVDVLIRAVCTAECPCRLTVIGDGPEESRLRTLASQNSRSNTVSFLGRLTREETLEKMKENDVFAMVSSPETFGLVYLEAMSKGCIVIGSKGEGIDGVITHRKNGFLLEPGNERELKETIEGIARLDTQQRVELIKSALHTARTMTDSKMAQFYLEKLIDE